MTTLQYDNFESTVDLSFWEALAKNKINEWKLDDSDLKIEASYTAGKSLVKDGKTFGIPCRLLVTSSSFTLKDANPVLSSEQSVITTVGTLRNTNTMNDFKDLDKNLFLKDRSQIIWDAILNKQALENPQILSSFGLITFADLKKYKFYYWFAFPALQPPTPFKLASPATQLLESSSFKDVSERAALSASYSKFKAAHPDQAGFFLVRKSGASVEIGKLADFPTFFNKNDSVTIGFVDPSTQPSHPGWPLRNFLLMVQKIWNLPTVDVIALRDSVDESLYLQVLFDTSKPIGDELPTVIGWEKGTSGTATPRLANLGPMMDPKRLADTAVDLNLKLMRWRILPELNLEAISSKKCLLLGAGTLGCYVGRMLLAWGVRHITFVDNGKVSFSNPVRQPLFTFQDCLEGGSPKSVAAAKALEAIFPGVKSEGIELSIPMPGHSIDTDSVISERLEILSNLISSHDAVFLLTDSRESRWLPTVLGAHHKKIVINTALGFDSFLVIRHGYRDLKDPPKNSLGCYFCNDVVAPVDSLTDRTLDQQCTVTRPGLSGLASAVAVELLASIFNHPEGIRAKADTSASSASTPLGILPHQVRGFLGTFNNMLLEGAEYDKCTACSTPILEAYEKEGKSFLLKALRTPSILEEITGLKEMKQKVDLDDFELEGDEDDF